MDNVDIEKMLREHLAAEELARLVPAPTMKCLPPEKLESPESRSAEDHEHLASCAGCQKRAAVAETTSVSRPSSASSKAHPGQHRSWLPFAWPATAAACLAVTFSLGYVVGGAGPAAVPPAMTVPVEMTFEKAMQEGRDVHVNLYPPTEEAPGEALVELEFTSFLRPPYYAALEVLWGDDPDAPRDTVYWAAGERLRPEARMKSYSLPAAGVRPIEVQLFFLPTGVARDRLGLPEEIVKTIPLELRPSGITLGSGVPSRDYTIEVHSPAPGPVPAEFDLEFTVYPPKAATPGTEKVLQVLMVPEPTEDQGPQAPDANARSPSERLFVLAVPWPLGSLAPTGERFRVRVEPAALIDVDRLPQGSAAPTRFRLLFLELPVSILPATLSRRALDLESASFRGCVREELVIDVPTY